MENLTTQPSNKSNVLLIELVIVVLFFALTAVTAMQLFVASHQKSGQNARIQRASILAQDWAERLTGEPDPPMVLLAAGFERDPLTAAYAKREGPNLTAIECGEEQMAAGVLVRARIDVFDQSQFRSGGPADTGVEPLVSLTVESYIPGGEVAG